MRELVIDNFSGGGGASTGIRMATGRDVDVAINHDSEALALHEVNHPTATHYCEDVFNVDPAVAVAGHPVVLAWFSPDCKHFSKAKGSKPKSKKIRGLAWVMVRWAAVVQPRVMVLENVEEFKTWGPLLPDGSPCPVRKGNTFRAFVAQLRKLGYEVEWKEMRACDYGAPTIRKRLFLIARCDGKAIVWPKPTHGKPDSIEVRSGVLKPWRTAADCIDWALPCPSIFDRKRPLAEATMRRIARGIQKFVIESKYPFLVPARNGDISLTHVTKFRTGSTGSDVKSPLPTITAGPKENPAGCAHAMGVVEATLSPAPHDLDKYTDHAQIASFISKHYTGVTGSDMREPIHTVTSIDHNSLTAVHIVRQFGQSVGSKADDPVGTICAGGAGKTYFAVSHLTKMYGTSIGQSVDDPLHTVTGGGNHIGEVRAFFEKYYESQSPVNDLRWSVFINGEKYVIVDIGLRMLEPHELYAAQGFPDDYVIAPIVKGRKLPKHAQVRMCGNSVCPPMAAAIVSANYSEKKETALAA